MDTTFRRLSLPILSALGISALSACSGGGGGGGSDEPVDPDVWQKGVFHDASNFAKRCDSVTPQNNWLRSWSNDTYLWYDEIPDLNPANYGVPTDYFELLKTDGLSPSGGKKDNYHYWMDTEEWEQQSGSGVSVGYGFQLALLESKPPRSAVVAFSDRDGQWSEGVSRGMEIVSVDGVDLRWGDDVDTLNAGLFPSEAGEEHTIVFGDPSTGEQVELVLTSSAITMDPVQNVQVLERGDKRVGYMLFNSHIATAESALYDAVNELTVEGPVDELVLDLRYNGGGLLEVASQLAYMIAGSEVTAGKTFEEILFNDKHPDRDPVRGVKLEPIPFIQTTVGYSVTGGKPLPTLNLKRVFVLTGSNTCSASESIINGLRGVDVEVVQVGAQTCGKPYGFYPTDNCGTTYFTIQYKGENEKGFGEYADGFIPSSIDDGYARVRGCAVDDDFSHPLGDESEFRLATALNYIAEGDCGVHAYSSYTSYAPRPLMGVRLGTDGAVAKPLWRQNRIMLLER